MPVIDGKPRRSRFTKLELGELSSVDFPAQAGARAVILKRDDASARAATAAYVAKYVCAEDGAHTFTEVLAENEFSQKIWPYTDALSQSIRSIVGDRDLGTADRENKIGESVQQFLAEVRSISSGEAGEATMKVLEQLLTKKGTIMPDTKKDQQDDVATLKADVERLTGELETAKAKAASMEEEMEEAKNEAKTAKAALAEATKGGDTAKQIADLTSELETTKAALAKASDETFEVEGQAVHKSVVGEQVFQVMKAQEDRVRTAEFEKRAATEFPNVVGTAKDVGLILKARDGADEATQKALDRVLKANQEMAKAGFERLGGSFNPDGDGDVKKAKTDYSAKVDEVAKRDGINKTQAATKVRRENPELFAAAYPVEA